MGTLALNRRRLLLWRALAVLAALGTGLSIYSYLSWLRAQIPIAGRLVPLPVASLDLEAGTVIDRSMVRMRRHPEAYLPEGALRGERGMLGRVVRVPILAGEPILARKLGETGGLSSLVPGGYRAYLLAVPRGSGAGFLPGFLPGAGDRVDVIATFPAEVFGEATSITILRSTEVARGPGPPRPQSGSREGSLGRLAEGSGLEAIGEGKLTIPLLVTPEEAERLAMAEALGRITVTLAPQAPEEAEGQGASSGPLVSRNLVRR